MRKNAARARAALRRVVAQSETATQTTFLSPMNRLCRPRFWMPIPMKPTEILSFGLILADNMPDGRMNGTLATALDWRKRRRDRELDFMRRNLPKMFPLKSLF